MTPTILKLILLLGLLFSVANLGFAAKDEKTEKADKTKKAMVSKEAPEGIVSTAVKSFDGEVSARGPNGIAIVHKKDAVKKSSEEIWFPYEGEVQLIGYGSKTDIGEGDRVRVTYEEFSDGSKRQIKGIHLLMKRPPEEVIEESESE